MPTREQAKKAYEHGRKSQDHYNGLTTEQKSAFWYYGRDSGYIQRDSLSPAAQGEYDKFVFKNELQYAPNVYKNKELGTTELRPNPDNYSSNLKADKYGNYTGPTVPLRNDKPSKFSWDKGNSDTGKDPLTKLKSNVSQDPLLKFKPSPTKEPKFSWDKEKPFTPMPKLSPRQLQVNAELQDEPKQLVVQKTPTKQLVVGKGVKKQVTPQAKITPKDLNQVDNPVIRYGAKGASLLLEGVNNLIQSPATISVRAGEGVTKAETEGKNIGLGLLKGIGTGIKDVLAGQNTVNNAQLIEAVAPKTTAELKTKYPKAYNVASTLAEFVGADDLLGLGIVSDLSKVRKLNNMPSSTKELNNLFSKIKTNAPLTVAEQAIVKEHPDLVITIRMKPRNGNISPLPLRDIKPKQLSNNISPAPLNKIVPKPLSNIKPQPLIKNTLKPIVEAPKIPLQLPRRLPNTIINSPLTKPELKAGLKKLDLNYNPLKNNDTLQNAKKLINADYDKAIRIVKEGPASAESNAVGMELVGKLQKENRYTEAIDIIETISKKATESGQAIQALSMWGRLTPEGMLKYTQSMFDKANSELTKQGFKDISKLKLTEDFAKDITGRMKAIGSMAESRAKTVEIAKVLRDIDEQLPKSVWQKVSTVQTMAQLLNPKTMIRNIAGNTIFGGLENVSNVVGAPIDKVISKLTGQRTTILPSLKTQLEAGKVDLVEAVQDALMGIDTKGIGNKFELGNGPTFKGNTLFGKLEKGMNVGLKATDAGFSGAARAESLRQQMKIAGVSEPTPGMIEIADKIAKYRTFQDNNHLSNGFKAIKDGLNKLSGFFTGTTEWGLGDLVLKYAKTPANILARGIDYSPVGTIKAINEAVKPLRGKVFNQKEFVDAISRSATGTGLIVLGYQLNKMGLITGAADKDYDVATLQRDIGKGEYKLNTTALGRYLTTFDQSALKPKAGDTYSSWDWAAPTSIMLGVGANISQNKGNTSDLLTTLVNATASGMNTIFEQPLLSGVQRFTGGYDQTQNLVNTLQTLPSSFTPSLLNQAKQLTDNTTRNTYDPSIGKETLNKVKARIPGLANTLQPRITTLGKPKETFKDNSNSIFNVLLNPSNTSKYTPTPGSEMVLDIYEKSGEKIQFPRVAATYIMDKGQKINLLPAEVTKLQTMIGEKTAKQFDMIAQSKSFRSQKPEVQAKKLQSMLTEINQEAKKQLLKEIRERLSR
jgi:hypothetical protein